MHVVRAIGSTILMLAAQACCGIAHAQGEASRADAALSVVVLSADGHPLRAEVARTEAERLRGLMGRPALAEDAGMLFAFPEPRRQCFWMHDTRVALSAAFVGDDGEITDIVDMAPLTESRHCSARPVRFVLEMARGWFARHAVAPGAYLTGEPFTR